MTTELWRRGLKRLFGRNKGPKVFCIGRNKTGTTSLAKALRDLGYKVGNQRAAELLIHDYARRDFRSLVRYCRTADAFQDIPFSLPYTFQVLDYAFPGSKFVLSIRDDENEWYQSLIRFHAKRLKKRIGVARIPTKDDLMSDPYVYQGWLWEVNRIVYGTPEDDPFNERILKEHYLRYNEQVLEYFRFRPNDLLVINLKDKGSYKRFCDFLGVAPVYEEFPWLNRSADP